MNPNMDDEEASLTSGMDEEEAESSGDEIYNEHVAEEVNLANEGYALSGDVYTYALLTWLGLRQKGFKVIMVAGAILFMVLVAALQFTVTYAIWQHTMAKLQQQESLGLHLIEDSHLCGHPLQLTRISPVDSEAVCGVFQASRSKSHPGYWEPYLWPTGSWSPKELDPENLATLQTILYKLFIMNPQNGAFWVFLSSVMCWTAAVLAEVLDVWNFFRKACALPHASRKFIKDGDSIQLVALSGIDKIFVAFIATVRLVLACFLYIVGCGFLQETTAVADLLLNAVALGFVLELDVIFYKASSYLSAEQYVEKVTIASSDLPPDADDEDSLLASTWSRFRISFQHLLMFVIILSTAYLNKAIQMKRLENQFKAFAAACLYIGPTPDISRSFSASFPVPSFCESIVCSWVDGHECMPKSDEEGFTENIALNGGMGPYLKALAMACSHMLQTNSTPGSHFPNRQADADLAEVNLTDPAANFWCPTTTVKQKLGITCVGQVVQIKSIADLRDFWNDPTSCQTGVIV